MKRRERDRREPQARQDPRRRRDRERDSETGLGAETRSRRSAQDFKKKLWLSVSGLKHLPENFVFCALKAYACSARGDRVAWPEQIKDFGTSYPEKVATAVDVQFGLKLGLETRLFETYHELHLVVEVLVLDDVDRDLQARLFGVAAVPLAADSAFAQELPLYFELPGEGFLEKVLARRAETHPAVALLVQASAQEQPAPASFVVAAELASKHLDFLRGYNRSILRAPLHQRLREVFEKLRETGADLPELGSADRLLEEARRRVGLPLPVQPWACLKYLLPFDRSSRKVFVRVDGYLNLESDLCFSRCLLNPDPRGKKRPIYSAGLPDFDQSNPATRIQAREIQLDLQNFSLGHHLLLDVVRVEFNSEKLKDVKLVEVGFCFLPLLVEDGYLNFGRFLAPVFTPPLDWSAVEEFASHGPWDLLEILLEENEQIKQTNRYAFISVTDEYRKVRAVPQDFFGAFPDFSKVDCDMATASAQAPDLDAQALREMHGEQRKPLRQLLPDKVSAEDLAKVIEDYITNEPLDST